MSVDDASRIKYGIQVTPSVAVLDSAGRLVQFFPGVPERAPLEEALRRASG